METRTIEICLLGGPFEGEAVSVNFTLCERSGEIEIDEAHFLDLAVPFPEEQYTAEFHEQVERKVEEYLELGLAFSAPPLSQESLSSIPEKQTHRHPDMNTEDYHIARAMIARGGQFVSSLGHAALAADPTNLAALKEAFSSYWEKYAQMVKEPEETQSKPISA